MSVSFKIKKKIILFYICLQKMKKNKEKKLFFAIGDFC